MCNKTGRILMLFALLAGLWLGGGCASVSVQSNTDATAVHKLNRVFILIQSREAKNLEFSLMLARDLRDSFTNQPPYSEVLVATPLDLDETVYQKRITAFDADSVLFITPQFTIDVYGGYPTITYDASLFDPVRKKREWRALITSSGSTDAMGRRMQTVSDSIISRLKQDGFL